MVRRNHTFTSHVLLKLAIRKPTKEKFLLKELQNAKMSIVD
jgi:hypothetical protein